MKSRDVREQAVIRHLRMITRTIQAQSRIVERTCGLSSAQLWMLQEISVTPGIKVSELATTLAIHRSTCSNMLDKLEDKALIYRDRSKTDQRTVHLFPTGEGKKLLSATPAPPQETLSRGLQKLSHQQLLTLEKGLQDLVHCLYFDDKTSLPEKPARRMNRLHATAIDENQH